MNQPTEIVLERQITRADGTKEPAQVVAYYHKNPVKRLLARVRGVKGKVTLDARSRQAPC